ncbi:MAG: hypothetical protein ACRC8S_00295 [Fimbriiglobus sp.]
MSAIKAIVRNGRIETEEPINLPDGTELRISIPGVEDIESDWDTSPEGIEAWIARTEAIPPLAMTEQEWAVTEAWLKECDRKATEKLHRDLDGMFS